MWEQASQAHQQQLQKEQALPRSNTSSRAGPGGTPAAVATQGSAGEPGQNLSAIREELQHLELIRSKLQATVLEIDRLHRLTSEPTNGGAAAAPAGSPQPSGGAPPPPPLSEVMSHEVQLDDAANDATRTASTFERSPPGDAAATATPAKGRAGSAGVSLPPLPIPAAGDAAAAGAAGSRAATVSSPPAQGSAATSAGGASARSASTRVTNTLAALAAAGLTVQQPTTSAGGAAAAPAAASGSGGTAARGGEAAAAAGGGGSAFAAAAGAGAAALAAGVGAVAGLVAGESQVPETLVAEADEARKLEQEVRKRLRVEGARMPVHVEAACGWPDDLAERGGASRCGGCASRRRGATRFAPS